MSTNNLPAVNGKDAGTWRRICAVPFNSTFKENPDPSSKYQFPIDKSLDAKFSKWKVVFMSMLIEVAFRTKGMVPLCEMVKVNSDKYRKDQDYLTSFVADNIVEQPEGTITDRQISDKFKEWWKLLYGNNPPKGKELFDYIHKIYIDKPNIRRKGTTWKGLTILNDEEEMVDNV
jgi:phage/plasmid-associated DNA primase